MKSFLLVSLLSLFTFNSHAAFNEGPNYAVHPLPGMLWERQGCSFLCDSIPEDFEVLKSFGEYSRRELPAGPLNVLVWNIYKGRKKNFVSQFRYLAKKADLVLLSEATDGELVKPTLDEMRGFGWEMAINFFMKNEVATGVLIGSPAVPAWRTYLRTTDLEPGVKSPKTMVIAKYPLSDERALMAISIHGINWKGDEAFERQLKAAEPFIAQHSGPIIFAGDFNTKNANRHDTLVRVTAKYGLKRAPWSKASSQLDDAFIRGIEVHSAEMLDEVIAAEGSDHPALLLRLTPH